MTRHQLPMLLSLPYDIRYLIYQHLFPRDQQIYLQALQTKQLVSNTPTDVQIPTSFLRTCRQLNSEAGEYLYNNYLFNIIGRKTLVLEAYPSFKETVQKFARAEVHVDAFSNGEHSATMCISVHTGDGKIGTLVRRQRGVAMKIEDVKAEVESSKIEASNTSLVQPGWTQGSKWAVLLILVLSVAVALLAWWMSSV